jgi:glycosyltransferase 2 family protein
MNQSEKAYINRRLILLLKISIPLIIGLALFWIAFEYIDFKEFFEIISKANIWYVLLYFLISIILLACAVARWKLILLSQKKNINFIYLFKAYLAGYAVSYLTPSAKLGGEPIRALMLNKKGVKTPEALSSIIIDKTLELGGSLIFFIIGVILLTLNYTIPGNLRFLMIIISAIFIFLIGFFIYGIIKEKWFILRIYKFFKLHKMKKLEHVTEKIIETEKLIIKFYKRDKKHFLMAMIVMLIAWTFMFIEFKLAMLIFGFDANLLHIFLTFSVVGAAYMIPVPFAIGTLEGGQVALFKTIGLSSAIGLGVGLLTRVRDSLTAIVGLIIAGYYGVFTKKKKEKKKRIISLDNYRFIDKKLYKKI